MRTLSLLTIAVLSTIPVAAQNIIPIGHFRSIELRNGGHVIVRHGQTQRVTVLSGKPRVRLAENERLVIDHCKQDCPRGERVRVEIITPEVSAVAVSNGGRLQTLGAFPARADIAAAVESGGMIDIRSIPADAVTAAIDSGGRIFTTARKTLNAAVVSGGGITYWGNAQVQQAISDGGVVQKGTPGDHDKPLSELGPT